MTGWIITGLVFLFFAEIAWSKGDKAKACVYYLLGCFCCAVGALND